MPLSKTDRALLRGIAQAAAADAAGHMVGGPVPHIRRYVGPDASKCTVCGRPWCAPESPAFRECETAYAQSEAEGRLRDSTRQQPTSASVQIEVGNVGKARNPSPTND